MVIQPNMETKSIVTVWPETKIIFAQYNIQISNEPLEKLCHGKLLTELLKTLNETVGSSSVTCVEGG